MTIQCYKINVKLKMMYILQIKIRSSVLVRHTIISLTPLWFRKLYLDAH